MAVFSVEETETFVTGRGLPSGHAQRTEEPGPRAGAPARACTAPRTGTRTATAARHREASGATRGAGTGRAALPQPGGQSSRAPGEGADTGLAENTDGVLADARDGRGPTFRARWPGACSAEPAASAPPSGPASPTGSALPVPRQGQGEAGAQGAGERPRSQSPCSAQSCAPRTEQGAGTWLLRKGLRGDLWELDLFLRETRDGLRPALGCLRPSGGRVPAPRADGPLPA